MRTRGTCGSIEIESWEMGGETTGMLTAAGTVAVFSEENMVIGGGYNSMRLPSADDRKER